MLDTHRMLLQSYCYALNNAHTILEFAKLLSQKYFVYFVGFMCSKV